jgi:hypothetical protein
MNHERDAERAVRLLPHRFGQRGYVIEFRDGDGLTWRMTLTEQQYRGWFGWLRPSFRWQTA